MRRAGIALAITRLTFLSSSIRCSWVGRRPAVSASTTSMPAAARPGSRRRSPPPGRRPPARSPRRRCARPRRRAARARRRGTCRRRRAAPTFLPLAAYLASLPIDVVLPAPLTPATMMTNGLCPVTASGRSSGASSAASSTASASFSACGVSIRSLFARVRSRAMSVWVASRPASAEMSTVSRSSNSCSSTFVPPKSPVSCEPVFLRPRLSRSSQEPEDEASDVLAEVEHCRERAKIACDSSKPPLMSRSILLILRSRSPPAARPRIPTSGRLRTACG